MNIDWNPVLHVLDELSEGTHSFLELSDMAHHYGREPFLESLLFLADRELVELSSGRDALASVPRAEWQHRLQQAFGVGADPSTLTINSLDLTEKGEQILRLFNIGHPPLS